MQNRSGGAIVRKGNDRHLEDAAMALASVELTKITRLRRGVIDYAAVN